MSEEKILSKEELITMFEENKIIDTGRMWKMGDKEVDIIAIHEVEPKYLQDITKAKFYKIVPKNQRTIR